MDFDFTFEQTQLADAVRRFVEKDYGFEFRRQRLASNDGTAVWEKLVELGLTALPIPEAQGGFAGTAADLLPVMQELGRGLIAEPYFATVVAAEAVRRAGHAARLDLLEAVAAGTAKMAVAFAEKSSRHDPLAVATRAERRGDGFVIDGEKSVVLFGAQADHLVVSAMLDGALAVFLVDATKDGIGRHDARTLDGQRIANIRFDRVALDRDDLLAHGEAAVALVDTVIDYGVALLCAEAVGTMEALNAATLEYAKTRKQFGQPIARFQVLQHRMVDMFIHLEQARSMAYLVAAHASSDDAIERRRIASAAKVRIGQAARFIGQQAVQIHGGMGMTNELPAAHLFKRLTMIEMTFGDTDHHLQRFIATPAAREASVPMAGEPLQRAA